jgi:mono/diheme cytochrome c family protein/glucose/arabinose dehydrogenase
MHHVIRAALALSPLLPLIAGEDMPPPPAHWKIPPAPVVEPKDVLASFKLQDGYRLELLAAEPVVEDPVDISFDADGRMFVCEMRGYMPDTEAKGEDATNGRVTLLEDVDGDGTYEKSTVFVDGLVMPRSVMCVNGGVLVVTPPTVWFCRDTNGDGKADEKVAVIEGYGKPGNPEHTSNNPTWMLDNWIYSANHTERYRLVDGAWKSEKTTFRGQWGMTQDDVGRPYYNTNSDQLRMDQVPSAYYARNPNLRSTVGLNVQPDKSQTCWPARITPGVNRGYRKGTLRDDGTLASFTAVCGAGVYRGDLFPDWVGDIFVCEPSANFVRRAKASEKDGALATTNAYNKSEFIGGLDERFRPVNTATGPEGALYIVDMYQGVLQHKIFLTPYLKAQALERGLDKPINLGRIYRVVPEKFRAGKPLKLAKAPVDQLVAALAHANGFWRDTAQRLLVERQEKSAIPALRALAISGTSPLGQQHALWTLDGLGDRDPATLTAALGDKDARVRIAALRVGEALLGGATASEWLAKLAKVMDDADARVRLQLAFSLGAAADGKGDGLLEALALARAGEPLVNEAILSGLAGREFAFLTRLTSNPAFTAAKTGHVPLIVGLAGCVLAENKPGKISALLTVAATQPKDAAWRQAAIVDGVLAAKPKGAKNGAIKLKSKPDAWDALAQVDKLAAKTTELSQWIVWEGGAATRAPEPPKLDAKQQKRFDKGRERYLTLCVACHQLSGQGLAGLAPPLAASEWVEGSEQRLARIVLHGVRGEISAAGVVFNVEMPPLGGALDDTAIAEILTYVRNEWGNRAEPVEDSTVKAIRVAEGKRGESWTVEELMKIK